MQTYLYIPEENKEAHSQKTSLHFLEDRILLLNKLVSPNEKKNLQFAGHDIPVTLMDLCGLEFT